MNNIWPEPELPDPIRNTGRVTECVDEQDTALSEWRHLAQCAFQRAKADLGRDRKVESAPLRHLTLDPHIALHQVDEPLGDRKS